MTKTVTVPGGRFSRRNLVLGAAVTGVGAIVAGRSSTASASGFTTGSQVVNSVDSVDSPNEADFGFCTDMTAHHVQALVLCQRVLGRDTGDAVQAAAAEVLQNQAMEVGQMRAWLTDWGQSTTPPESVMQWMNGEDQMSMPLGMMPGYASASELQTLSTTTGLAQGRMFLELMRAHHVGGVEMATAATQLVATAKVRRLSSIQSQVQAFEITQYDQLLSTTYAAL